MAEMELSYNLVWELFYMIYLVCLLVSWNIFASFELNIVVWEQTCNHLQPVLHSQFAFHILFVYHIHFVLVFVVFYLVFFLDYLLQ